MNCGEIQTHIAKNQVLTLISGPVRNVWGKVHNFQNYSDPETPCHKGIQLKLMRHT